MIDENAMTGDRPTIEPVAVPDDATDDSIAGRFNRLIESARDYAEAELDRQKLRAGLVGTALRQVAILIGMAAMLIFATILALMVGLIFALTDVVGAGLATVIVIVGALLISVVLVLVAKAKIVSLKEALKP